MTRTSATTRTGSVVALIVAGGRGDRAARGGPKQYSTLGGETVLSRTVRAFTRVRAIDDVLVVIGDGDAQAYREAVNPHPKLLPPVMGGASRQQSVRNGLEALAERRPAMVLVHDAARPFVTEEVILRVINSCDEAQGAIAAIGVTETLKRVEAGMIADTIRRDGMATAQTPQAFPFEPILAAHRMAARDGRDDFTDDAAVAAHAALPVQFVEGDRGNLKLTTPRDFADAERYLRAEMETRTAQGYDVHAFGPGDRLWLCGVEIAHERSLVGHSDADVGLHALTDALLGTIGEADIGQHFPPSDPQWKGAKSDIFLRHAVSMVGDKGGRIVNLDVTLVCEQPKVGPHRERMREAVADIAKIPVSRVSIKATTSEKLGFTGRGEGIAALALATVALPSEA